MFDLPSHEDYWRQLTRAAFSNQPAQQVSLAKDALLRKSEAVASVQVAQIPPLGLPSSISAWLGRLFLLYGLPFEYMVPDPNMLPLEAIRFFQVDLNWVNRAIDGAATIGLNNSADVADYLLAFEQVAAEAARAAAATRQVLRGKPVDFTAAPVTQMAGFLLRSVVVENFPGMEVTGYADKERRQPLSLLRLERLSPAVLLCLFDGLPAVVDFLQPPEGLHFGSHQTADGQSLWVYMRGLGFNGFAAGLQLPGKQQQTLSMRTGVAGVLEVAKTAADLKASLTGLNVLDPQGTFTSAEFAIQMTVAAGQQSYVQPGQKNAVALTTAKGVLP